MTARRIIATLAAGLGLGLLASPPAQATDTGPALQTPRATLDAALTCTSNVTRATRDPILLVPGTTETPQLEYSWGWEPALRREGRPYCTITLPGFAMGDIQTSAEYVVNAVRRMRDRSGRDVAIVGHSQGGMLPRWAVKYWPDVRQSVSDLVGLAPSNHGTVDAYFACSTTCQPSIWQQRTLSNFVTTLNRGGETFGGIDYTVAYTRTDEVVTPNLDEATGSSSLRTGDGAVENAAIQDVCPTAVTEHLGMGAYDPIAYALTLDALDHDGPASPSRIDRSVCAQYGIPGLDPATIASRMSVLAGNAVTQLAVSPRVPREPPLRPYAR